MLRLIIFGFIETPYRKVNDGKVDFNESPIYKTAEQEIDQVIAQANAELKMMEHLLMIVFNLEVKRII